MRPSPLFFVVMGLENEAYRFTLFHLENTETAAVLRKNVLATFKRFSIEPFTPLSFCFRRTIFITPPCTLASCEASATVWTSTLLMSEERRLCK